MSDRPESRFVWIDYTNYRGERAIRQILPLELVQGPNEWHPDAPWLIVAVDVAKDEIKAFNPAKLHSWGASAPETCAATTGTFDQIEARATAAEAKLASIKTHLDGVRGLSERATPGHWAVENGFLIAGCAPGNGPDDEVPDDWEPLEEEEGLYLDAKLNVFLDGVVGDFDTDMIKAAVNTLRDLLAMTEDREDD